MTRCRGFVEFPGKAVLDNWLQGGISHCSPSLCKSSLGLEQLKEVTQELPSIVGICSICAIRKVLSSSCSFVANRIDVHNDPYLN